VSFSLQIWKLFLFFSFAKTFVQLALRFVLLSRCENSPKNYGCDGLQCHSLMLL
jgi:hypothetical protein